MRDMDQKSCDGESVETISTCSGLFASGFESPCEGFESFDYGLHDDDAWPDTDDECFYERAQDYAPPRQCLETVLLALVMNTPASKYGEPRDRLCVTPCVMSNPKMSGSEVPQDHKSKTHEDRKEKHQPWVDMMEQPCRDQNANPIQPLNMPFPRKSQRAARSHVHSTDSSLDSANSSKKVDASKTEMDATQTPSPLALAKLTGALALRRARAMMPEVKMSIRPVEKKERCSAARD